MDWSTFLDRAGKRRIPLYVQGVWEPAGDPRLPALPTAAGAWLRMLRGPGGRPPHRGRREADSEPERIAPLEKLQRLAREQAVFVPVAEPRGDVLRVQRDWVKGYRFSPYFRARPRPATTTSCGSSEAVIDRPVYSTDLTSVRHAASPSRSAVLPARRQGWRDTRQRLVMHPTGPVSPPQGHLGCGDAEGGFFEFQGDHRDKLEKYLTGQGCKVKRVGG